MTLLLIPALPLFAATIILGWLVFLAAVGIGIRLRKRRSSRCDAGDSFRVPASDARLPSPEQLPRFAFVIPAHDEERGIAESVEATFAVDYPRDLFRVIVVADNCSDSTARIAREAGAEVLERVDSKNRGKGRALRLAFDHLLFESRYTQDDRADAGAIINGGQDRRGSIDAVVVMDADSQPCRGLLRGLAGRIAGGSRVIQVENGILNPDAAPLTWLLHVGNVMENRLFHEPKAMLGLPTVLRGNGMCMIADVLRTSPWAAFTTTEDTEYSLGLLEDGIRVDYLGDVWVRAESPTAFDQLYTQRLRWASGNAGLSKAAALRLIRLGIARRDAALVDAGWSLLVSSRPLLLLSILVPTALSAVLGMNAFVVWGMILLLLLALLLAAAMGLAGLTPRRTLWTLSLPLVAGQLLLATILGMIGFGPRSWVRTRRM